MRRAVVAVLAEAAVRARPWLLAVAWAGALLLAGYSTAAPVLYFLDPGLDP